MAHKLRVRVGFQAAVPWKEPDRAMELLHLLKKYDDLDLSPDRYGSSSSRTFELAKYSEEEIREIWSRVGGGVFKARKSWDCVYHLLFMKAPKAKAVSSFWVSIDDEYFRDSARSKMFITLCKDIYRWGNMDFGFVAHYDEYDAKNRFGENSGVGGANLKIALPGIYWVNLFGPKYVGWLGQERFLSLEGYANEQLSDGGWLVYGRDDLFQFETRSARQREKKLMKNLGRHAFFEMEKPNKKVSIPSLWGD